MSDHFTSSDDDLEEILQVYVLPKTSNYFEEVVPQLCDKCYIEHFRISREVTQQLVTKFETSEYMHHQEGSSEKVNPLKCISVFLWFSANEAASFRDVAERFNISKSTLHKIVCRVLYFLSNLSPQVIKWPTEQERVEIETFYRRQGFPGVIGIIDHTHIKINKPADDPESYLNRNRFFSIQAQMVCDNQRRIRDIFVGYPGAVHESKVFRASPLYKNLGTKCGQGFIIGGLGYPCLKHLLTPFKDRGQLTGQQRNYNYLLSKNKYMIEHCFGILKQKCRQLYHVKLRNIPDIVHFIRACAVLHNLNIDNDFETQEELAANVDGNQAAIVEGDNHEDIIQDDRDGVTRRNEVMNML